MSGPLPTTVLGIVETLAGPLLILVCFAFILYGIFLAQALYYWTTYENDAFVIKLWVILAGLFETCHTAMCMYMLYYYFIQHYGDFENGLNHIVWTAIITLYCEIGIIAVTQSFYVYRIWHISGKNQIVTGILSVILTARIGVGLYTTSSTFQFSTWEQSYLDRSFVVKSNSTWGLGVAVDLLITITLLYFLHHTQKLGLRRTRRIVRKLMHYSITTGGLTVVSSLIVLITYNTYTRSLLFAGMLEALSKLYANSMLAMINARRIVASSTGGVGSIGASNTIELSQLRAASETVKSNMNLRAIHVSKETSRFADSEITYNSTAQMTFEDKAEELMPV
ncbi:hypothetical protein BDW22DRAFT_1359242 [Trametopsis cervina]|nr:hypothetical protein BDW22DRAFT_1359242 [Trametopsis cervina]